MQTLILGINAFMDRKVSSKKAINLLAKNSIYIDEDEASTILEFLYLIAKSYDVKGNENIFTNPNEISNTRKVSVKSS